jgi:hypothetical protein
LGSLRRSSRYNSDDQDQQGKTSSFHKANTQLGTSSPCGDWALDSLMANEVVNNFPKPIGAGPAEKYVDFAWVWSNRFFEP